MIESIFETEGLKNDVISELETMGACEVCTCRYLGIKEPMAYRNRDTIRQILNTGVPSESKVNEDQEMEDNLKASEGGDEEGPTGPKLKKTNPCVACLGLFQDGVSDQCLDQIAEEIKKAGIEASSYGPMLSFPICLQIRAFSIWYHLVDKFPQVYKSLPFLKPEGIGIKTVWKWICCSELRYKVDPNSEWMVHGDLEVNMFLKYKDDDVECAPLFKLMRQRNKRFHLTRGTAEEAFRTIDIDVFHKHFTCPPSIPKNSLSFEKIECSHTPIFVAGRYCKYSRDVSQSPWLNPDGTRVRGEGSVQEFISEHANPIFNCESIRFSGSGREDSDVRMLGKGRPFVLEIVNPKKTIFTQQKIKLLQKAINKGTTLISVRDLQIVDKKDLNRIKDGEESKSKIYTALCKTEGREVTPEMLQLLNETKMPLVLSQITPLRVLHRRSLINRSRSVLSMRAEPAKRSKEMFILHVKTEAGTYVKEFVHGDFGRTTPSVSDLLQYPTEILALDVAEVELDWPPAIDD